GETNDIICVNTQVGAAAKPTNSIDSFCQPDKSQPYFTLPALFEIAAHPIIPQGVTMHRFLEISAFPAVAPFFMTGDGESELNVMPERFLQDEGNDEIGSQANVGNQYFAVGMSNNTHGKYKLAVKNPILTALQDMIGNTQLRDRERQVADHSPARIFAELSRRGICS
ncbi:hypothetical protein C8A00DRAFT_19511, partial [Chaetomidium leptoderma]